MVAMPGYLAVVRRCGRSKGRAKCAQLSLSLYHVSVGRLWRARLVGVVALQGREQRHVREALAAFPQLTEDDTEALLEVGRLLTPSVA